MDHILANWKTSLAGAIWLALYGAQTSGIAVPGVHLDPTSLPLALALLFAKDSSPAAAPTAPKP